jgi:hypothetical protein
MQQEYDWQQAGERRLSIVRHMARLRSVDLAALAAPEGFILGLTGRGVDDLYQADHAQEDADSVDDRKGRRLIACALC